MVLTRCKSIAHNNHIKPLAGWVLCSRMEKENWYGCK